MEKQIVHIGPGKLGLGFVGAFAKDLNLPIIFLNRRPNNDRTKDKVKILQQAGKYFIKYFDRADTDSVPVNNLHLFAIAEKDVLAAADAIADPKTAILTTAVGHSQLPEAAALIAFGLQKRGRTRSPLFILACENGPCPSDFLAEQVHTYLDPKKTPHDGIFTNCVVDRICYDYDPIENAVVVLAEPYKEWIVATQHRELKKLLKHPDIKPVLPNQIKLYETRKLWLVNGFHLALAVLGYKYFHQPSTRISDVLNSEDPHLKADLTGVKADFCEAIFHYDGDAVLGGKNAVRTYMDHVQQRFRISPDTCERILREALFDENRLKELTRQVAHSIQFKLLPEVITDLLEGSLFSFFQKVKERLYDPLALTIHENGRPDHLALIIQELIPFLNAQGEVLFKVGARSRRS